MDAYRSLRSRVLKVWRDGRISRHERDLCFDVIRWASSGKGDFDSLVTVVERMCLYPVFFRDMSLGGQNE